MSSALHEYIYRRFREVFGEPVSSRAKDFHWIIPPGSTALAAHVLVNGTLTRPAVWIFDPLDARGTYRTFIDDEAQADEIIKRIQGHAVRAGQSGPSGTPSG